jgi:hypothetical protein
MGSPELEKPHGTEIAGKPPMLNENVQAFCANGSPASAILIGKPGSVGTIKRSTLANAPAMPLR